MDETDRKQPAKIDARTMFRDFGLHRLQQVLWNLLSNAVKFTPEGGRVEARAERVETSAQITVSDTGRGISADLLPHVFVFVRGMNPTRAVLALLFVLLLSVIIMAVDSRGAPKPV